MQMTAKSEIDDGLRNALIDPDQGILKPGCMPEVPTASASGSKMLLDAIAKALSGWYCNLQNFHFVTYQFYSITY